MSKSKKTLFISLILLIFITCGCSIFNKAKTYTITIIILNEKNEIYNKKITTTETKLIDVLKNLNIKLQTEKSDFGDYIVSLKGLKQSENDEGTYYWDYYINNVYSDESISLCEIEDQTTYKFIYTYHLK